MAVDLTNCDREPIHIPGSIQAHGCLLACDAGMRKVLRHSANAAVFLELATSEINGKTPDALLGDDLTHDLRNALGRAPNPRTPGLLMGRRILGGSRVYDIAVHAYNGHTFVEFEAPAEAAVSEPLEIARAVISRIEDARDVKQLTERVPRLLRAALGYDRVMVYRFAEDGSGQVISEAKVSELETFLGQHFPASDIPKQARALYLKNPVRIINDAAGETVAIEPELDASGEPLDLSYAYLRSVSPIHTEYLRNMGVSASMSISIIVDGELWGLIACHHYSPRHLAMYQRVAAEMFGEVFSLKLETMYQREMLESSIRARERLDALMRDLTAHENVTEFIRGHLPDFNLLLPADGIGLFMDGTWAGHGSTPPKHAIASLASFLSLVAEGRIWASHELSAKLPETSTYADVAAGVLAIPLSQVPGDYLLFFRKEQVQTVEWAGNPDKEYTAGHFGDRLTPRKSFAVWKQTVEGQSLPWTIRDRQIGEAARNQLLEIILRHSEVLAAERRTSELRQKVLNEELNHRVKNILSLIKSLVSQPVDSERDLTDYVASLKGRIMALAYAHDQVVRSDGGGALTDLLEAELSPYHESGSDIDLAGPDIGLDTRAHAVMALVLHELATNAAKYGALSEPNAMLRVRWSLTPSGDAEIHWSESGGPEVKPPRRQGFGSVLLHRSIPFDLGGRSEVEYPASGLQARFLIPAKFVVTSAPKRARDKPVAAQPDDTQSLLAGRRVLLVEDQLVIALDAEQMLEECGAVSVDTAATPGEALILIREGKPDAAVLDVNLGNGNSFPIADELILRGIPFVFATGYGDSGIIPPSMIEVPIVRKPFTSTGLREGLAQVMPPKDAE
jgi:light-regulated signal transduction histidine kinase (bacteriophytochrome)/CheY-like chemotaxis protein